MHILSILYLIKIYLPLLFLIIIFSRLFTTSKKIRKVTNYGIFFTILISFVIAIYSTALTQILWEQNFISQFLLPEHNQSYFYNYVYFHYWKSFLISFLISIAWLLFLSFLKKYSQNKLLSKDEIRLGFFTALSVGFPLFIPYLFLLLLLFLFQQLINNIILKKHQPILILSSMIISAIIIILLRDILISQPLLIVLKN